MNSTRSVSRPSLRQFARMAGVSPATVSRVFSESELVAPDTRDRIIDLANSCGFRPTAINRVSFGGLTNSVGVMVPHLAVSFFADIATGLQRQLLDADILPVVLQSGIGGDRQGIRRLIDHRVDALVLVLIDESLTSDDFVEVIRADVPLLLLGPLQLGLSCDSVDSDDVQGGRLAGEHLIGLGHRRIGFVYYGEGQSTCDQRLAGFREVLSRAGLELDSRDIAHNPPRHGGEPELEAELRAILSRPDRPSAFFAPTDLLAMSIYRVARELGLRIPAALSVVGFGDLNFAGYVEPPLTSVIQDGVAIGERAGELIMARLSVRDAPRQTVILPTRLVLRESTAGVGDSPG